MSCYRLNIQDSHIHARCFLISTFLRFVVLENAKTNTSWLVMSNRITKCKNFTDWNWSRRLSRSPLQSQLYVTYLKNKSCFLWLAVNIYFCCKVKYFNNFFWLIYRFYWPGSVGCFLNFLFCLFFAFIHFGFFGPSTLLVADIILHQYHLKSRSRCFVLVQQQFGKTEWTPE